MRVDLNADVGESFGLYTLGDDQTLMSSLTSANIACGFHAGDPHVMRRTVQAAIAAGVAIGAHPGFPDLSGFGRRRMHLSPAEIEDIVVYQIGALMAMTAACGSVLKHVKPHGALYNMAATDRAMADAIVGATVSVNRHLVLVGLSGSALIAAGRAAGLTTASEAFADRGYDADGRLLPRHHPGAIIDDVERVAARAVAMVKNRTVETSDGVRVPLDVDTLCIHGDTPGASQLARAVRTALEHAGVTVAPLA